MRNSLLAVFMVLSVAFAGHVVADSRQTHEPGDRWVAPSQAAAKINPLAARPEIVAGGRKIFHERCAMCHGDDGRGTSRAPNLTVPDVQSESDGTLFWIISTGNTRAGMPTFSFLAEPQRWQLVLHLRTIRTK